MLQKACTTGKSRARLIVWQTMNAGNFVLKRNKSQPTDTMYASTIHVLVTYTVLKRLKNNCSNAILARV